jgi:hypothetical protein
MTDFEQLKHISKAVYRASTLKELAKAIDANSG